MIIPTVENITLPLLRSLSQRAFSEPELVDSIAKECEFFAEHVEKPSKERSDFTNLVDCALSKRLARAQLIREISSDRGDRRYEITALGQDLLKDPPEQITWETLSRYNNGSPTPPNTIRLAEEGANAELGTLPAPPNFHADTHIPHRRRLADLIDLAIASDMSGLEKYVINLVSSSPIAMDKYRNRCVTALRYQAAHPEIAFPKYLPDIAAAMPALKRTEKETAGWAEQELRHRYGASITDTDKMIGFALPDGRQIALQRDVRAEQIWLEDNPAWGAPPAITARQYSAEQPRHSNLPPQLRHQPPGGNPPRPVAMVTISDLDSLRVLLDWYDGAGRTIDRDALDCYKHLFLAQYTDFATFEQSSGGYFEEERAYKDALIGRAASLFAGNLDDEALGAGLLDVLTGRAGVVSGLLGWRTDAHIASVRISNPGVLEAATSRLAHNADADAAIANFVSETWPLLSDGQANKPYSESRNLPTMLAALIHPDEAYGINTEPLQRMGQALLGRRPLGSNPMTKTEYADVLGLAEMIRTIMIDEWGWKPRDLWDVQGFVWSVSRADQPSLNHTGAATTSAAKDIPMPTNLILYGPPGTGKTYATAVEAVRLCGEVVSDDREQLMATYRRLAEAGRIEFVTFHQSIAYEDFVEGLRPTTDLIADGEVAYDGGDAPQMPGGFRLQSRDGIFKQISERARLDQGKGSSAGHHLDRSRSVFKITLGRRGAEEDRIEEGLIQGVVHLGWGGDIDWSDERFDSFEEIRRKWVTEKDPDALGKDPNIEMMYTFRAAMQLEDYVVLSDGRDTFRAVGRITREYYFDAAVPYHPHRRPVEWLWIDRSGVAREQFYPNYFRSQSTYQMNGKLIDWDALDRIVFGKDAETSVAPRQYVLIVDEINRANISKVFGELITLLEPDKRLGMPNALKVRLPYSGEIFGVPANLHVVGTMNTADRSIALLDTALRRRFTFKELMPDPDVRPLKEAGARCGIDLSRLLSTINERVEYLFDREHQIGHAYFIGCLDRAGLDDVMRFKVIPLLAEYFYEDWSKVAAVLGDADAATVGDRTGGFLDRRQLRAPAGMAGEGEDAPRFSWRVRKEFDYAQLL
jgi:5-methylcytosine-specific restriction protein B